MSPREKRFIALISLVFCAIAIFCLSLYYIPTFLYVTLILGTCCVACYYKAGESLYARLGPHPRRGLTIPPALRRWFPGRTANGVPAPERLRSRPVKGDVRDAVAFAGQRRLESAIFRRDTAQSDSLLFSPRDILMGSYLGKPESPPAVAGRPRAGGSFEANPNPREQLRERLTRPNHAVYTPNRRLSFGEPLNNMGKFTITPQRHYPLQQMGTSSLGILPPAQWDGFRKKNVLTPRNSAVTHSPVTVKIARPDRHSTRSPFFDHLNSSGVLGSPASPAAPADPCSRETVLSMLKESRKREVEEDDDRSFVGGQKSKRRRNDSGGSAHSAFEPLLPNGAPSQLVPKPGNLKRGLNAVAEDSAMKRSRTSSISSVSCGQQAPSGTLGSARNPIRSSYSSSLGVAQGKKTSSRSLSPLSSPGSSRSQTPERASKKPREEEICSPSSASSVRSDKTATDSAPVTGKVSPAPEVPPVASSSSSAGSGKRKRKIPLVSSRRGDHISLPPPPELGYTITVKDLDQEKRAALSHIQKVLEDPAPEPEKPSPSPAVSLPVQLSSSTITTPTLSSLLAAPLPTESTPAAPIPVINLDPAPVTTADPAPAPTAAPAPSPNPLLESLKMMRGNAAATVAATMAAATMAAATAPSISVATSGLISADSGEAALKRSSPSPAPLPSVTPVSLPQPASFPLLSQPASTMPSAFTQVLGQAIKAPTALPTLGGSGLFSLPSPLASTASVTPSTAATPAATTQTTQSTNPLMASVFKPVFGAPPTTETPPPTSAAPETKPAAVPTFKPLFGNAASSGGFGQSLSKTSVASPSPVSQLFGGLSNSSAPGLPSEPAAAPPPAAKSLFGNWSAAPPATAPSTVAPAPSAGSAFQFGAASAPAPSSTATTVAAGNGAFTFGTMTTASAATQPQAAAPPAQAKPQGGFTFGQASAPGTFGGFGMGVSAATTSAAAAPPATQSSFAFGKPAFDTSSAIAAAAFPTTTQAAAAKPFAFGSSAAAGPSLAPAPAPFAFGGGAPAATTAPSTFGSSAKPAFGTGSTGFAFGSSTPAPSAAAAPPAFGAAAQAPSAALPPPASTFTFGGGLPQINPATPAQPAGGGFNFGAAVSGGQFGSPVLNNPATQTPGFNFGSAAANDKPAFGTSTPAFGQSVAPGPIAFGTPGTPVQGFNTPSPFGSPSTPSFSIGAGSKPSGARQRLQARRQHPRKK